MPSTDDTLMLISQVTTATTKEELLQRTRAAARTLGYDYVLHGIEMRVPTIGAVQDVNSGYPVEYRTLYEERAFVGRDPTVAHCLVDKRPLVWSEHMYLKAPGAAEIMEESQRFGLNHGLSLPVHEAGRVVSMLSLARDRPFESKAEEALVISSGNVLAHCVHVAAENIILPALLQERRSRLSPREQQCLQLVAQGKSNWDIGMILNVSEDTVAFHMKNMMKKLQVASRVQAVAVGVALGLIR